MVAQKDIVQPIRSIDAMKFHIKVWRILGLWPPSTTISPAWTLILYRVYSFFFFGIFFVLFTASLLMNLVFVANISEVVDTLLVSSTVLLATLKGFCIISKLSKLRETFDIINRLDDFVINDEQRLIIGESMKTSRRLVVMLSCCYYCGVTSGLILSIVGSELKLMWPAWYPGIPWQDDMKWFWIILLFQFVASMLIAVMDSSADVYGTAMSNLLSAHLDSLSLRLKAFGNTTRLESNKIETNRSLKLELEIKECVIYYRTCIR